MAKLILYFLLFIIPFIVLPFGTSEFETPKIIISEIAIILLLLTLIWKDEIKVKHFLKIKFLPIIILFLIGVYDLVFLNGDLTALGNPFRLQGVYLIWVLLLFCLLSSIIKTPLTKLFPTIIFFIFGLLTIFFGTNLADRAIGTLGEPNSLASETLFLWPLAFYYLKNRPLKIVVLLSTLGIVLLSGSRSGLIGFIVQMIFLILVSKLKINLKLTTIICLILGLLSQVIPFLVTYQGLENRSLIWQVSIQSFLQNPILGSGFGNLEQTLHNIAGTLNNPIQYIYVDSTHNFLFDYLVQTGLLGFISILALIYQAINKFIKDKNQLYLILLIGIMITMLFNPLSISILIIFWFLLSQGLA